MKYRFFDWRDFERCVPRCSEYQMNDAFMYKLDKARQKAGVPFYLNSAFRTVAWEKAKGRSGTSSHTKGIAVDIECNNDSDRLCIIKGLLYAGFTRLGIYETFIHVDSDETKPNCIWYGK